MKFTIADSIALSSGSNGGGVITSSTPESTAQLSAPQPSTIEDEPSTSDIVQASASELLGNGYTDFDEPRGEFR